MYTRALRKDASAYVFSSPHRPAPLSFCKSVHEIEQLDDFIHRFSVKARKTKPITRKIRTQSIGIPVTAHFHIRQRTCSRFIRLDAVSALIALFCFGQNKILKRRLHLIEMLQISLHAVRNTNAQHTRLLIIRLILDGNSGMPDFIFKTASPSPTRDSPTSD